MARLKKSESSANETEHKNVTADSVRAADFSIILRISHFLRVPVCGSRVLRKIAG
jgi:hypothetical protein